MAVASFAIMVDYPDTAHFLTEDERDYILDRLKHHGFRGEGAEKVEEDDEFSGQLSSLLLCHGKLGWESYCLWPVLHRSMA